MKYDANAEQIIQPSGAEVALGIEALDWLVRKCQAGFCEAHPKLAKHGRELRGLPALAELTTEHQSSRWRAAVERAAWAATQGEPLGYDAERFASAAVVSNVGGDDAWAASAIVPWSSWAKAFNDTPKTRRLNRWRRTFGLLPVESDMTLAHRYSYIGALDAATRCLRDDIDLEMVIARIRASRGWVR